MFRRFEERVDPAVVMHGGLRADHTCFLNTPFNRLPNRLKLVQYDHR